MTKNIVLDTNIWVSYFISGRFVELSGLCTQRGFRVYSSTELTSELEEVLGRKKFNKYLKNPIPDYVDFHRSISYSIDTKAMFNGSPDSKDNFLFDLAIQSQAEFLVTGDKLLLGLLSVENIQLVSLSNFLRYINLL